MLYSTKRFPLIFYSLLLLYFTKAIGQTSYNLPAVINPSPQSQAFTRYGDYPMSDYTGLTDITVPIHTITGRKLSLPVNMSFHSSGRMANEVNGILGMRWTLNCGGLVTRTMKGAPDEWTAGRIVPYTVNPYHEPSFEELYSACPDGKIQGGGYGPWYDTEFDIFSYVLPNGKQGHFILKDNNGVKVPMMIPYSPLKIEFAKGLQSRDQYERIEITDVDGAKYIFGGDAVTSNALETIPEWDQQADLLQNVTTAWYLTKIISSDGTDEISLSYSTRIETTYNASQVANIGDEIRDCSVLFVSEDCDYDPYECNLMDYIIPYHFDQQNYPDAFYSYTNSTVPVISGIQFAGGSVSFNYTTAPGNGPYDNSNKQVLNEIIINKVSGQFKKVKFNSSLHAGEVDIYYLDNLSFYGEDPNVVNEKYDFSYYDADGIIFPIYYASMYKDWWGYACSPAGLSSLLPAQTVGIDASWAGPNTLDVGFNVQRDANEQYKTMGMLKTITYPTGGKTEFAYEGNRYDIGNSASSEGPGLRIKEVISRPGNGGKDIHKIYKYGETENGNGFIDENVRPGSYSRQMLTATQSNVMHFWEYTVDLGGGQQPIPSTFPETAGYRNRDYFSDPYIRYDFPGSPIKYDVVREYYLEDYIPKQKTESRYSWPYANALKDFIVTDHEEQIVYSRKYSDPQYAWQTPTLDSKTFFKYSNGQFDPVKKESYFYTADEREEAWDMPTYLHTNVAWARADNGSSYDNVFTNTKKYHEESCSVYGYGYRRFVSGNQNLYEIKTEEFTPDGTITVVKDMTYDPTYNFLKTEEVMNSKNELTKTTYSYPHDFPGSTLYQQMVQQHVIAPVIENTTTVNGAQTKKTVTNYYNPSSGIFVPQSVENQTGNNPQEVIATFNRYDNLGHILEQQKANNVKEVYLWGYQSRYPVAKILNSTYDAAIAIVPQSVLDAAGNGDDGAFRSSLNNLRNIPGALVETYTYKPFVGITSSTDANGRTTYYEYDGFGRLIHIRDKDNNIVKKFCYNYAGQTESCPLSGNTAKSGTFIKNGCTAGNAGTPVTYTVPANTYFGPNADVLAQNDVNANGQAYADQNGTCVIASYNVDMSEVFTKDNCTEGGTGSTVTYSVAAGKYAAYSQAAANQLAQNEIIANGQNNANANGYCTWYNDEKSGDFTKNDCQAGFTGTMYTYTVPEHTYSSTISKAAANQLAQNDVNENGQWQANSWGSCEDHNAYLVFQNYSGHAVEVWLYNNNNPDEYYYLTISYNQFEVPLTVPAGTYDIAFAPDDVGSNDHYFYSIGCDYSGGGYGPLNFYGIQLGQGTSCNTISIN